MCDSLVDSDLIGGGDDSVWLDAVVVGVCAVDEYLVDVV